MNIKNIFLAIVKEYQMAGIASWKCSKKSLEKLNICGNSLL